MSIWSGLWSTVKFVNSLDNRYRKRVAKNALDFVAAASDNEALSKAAKNAATNVRNTPLKDFETNKDASISIAKAVTTPVKTNDKSWWASNTWTTTWWEQLPENKTPEAKSAPTPSKPKWNTNTTTTQTNSAPAKTNPVQYQPDEYEAYRQRTMNNWTTYNQVYEDAVNRFLANPESFTQDQKNALIEMWNKLWYDLWTNNYSAPAVTQPTAAVQNWSYHDKYYAAQWTPLWFTL